MVLGTHTASGSRAAKAKDKASDPGLPGPHRPVTAQRSGRSRGATRRAAAG
jgi:hypothetical protein